MSDFWILRRLRAYRATRKSYEPFTLMDILLDSDSAPPGSKSTVEVTLLGFRARSEGMTFRAAFKALRREHPVLVFTYCAYFTCLALVVPAVIVVGSMVLSR
ncbi:hypothetical protein OHU11_03945 [Streptomyces sp. NBC_00257]|uniref:hypothetical protein n=1 Tax=unclassified Streptomyces TaxID=2593676 RepID=UPI0022583FF0|nr:MULTISPECIES: hypothetical protein [unclassified Streptomyces]MCX4398801.1 hypothetical protein [Streptomyces sp. NBC_01767]MCX4870891.1 hypothetical protein [Streptomyces sp. NBC_00906]MCX4901632.1 hypothetical protein [Streptomyces sp. NBC_00892]MCX5426874.1 hypothetical protein [Streptomyces sp. NBC_00062]WSP51097.1 hypothetical protein OG348_37620 [Streptomyces sp. NBC_01243]